MDAQSVAAANAAVIFSIGMALSPRGTHRTREFLEQVANELLTLAPTLPGDAGEATRSAAELLIAAEFR